MAESRRDTFDIVLLLALPASGKSELRKFLRARDPQRLREAYHIGPMAQLDDFPYVHLMRRVDEELLKRSAGRVFFAGPEQSFLDGRHWGTLVELLNEDEAQLGREPLSPQDADAGTHLLERMQAAARRVGAECGLDAVPDGVRQAIAEALRPEERARREDLIGLTKAHGPEATLVLEFARGGPEGSSMPLAAPHGYEYSLGRLSASILSRAVILYVWVTPEESRRKNAERADPNDPGSILHHGVPEAVMRGEYGCDDMAWLESNARVPGTICVESAHGTYDVPFAKFDNRVDQTSFIRGPSETWDADAVARLDADLVAAFTQLHATWNKLS